MISYYTFVYNSVFSNSVNTLLYYIILHHTKLHSIIAELHYINVGHVMLYAIIFGYSIFSVAMLHYIIFHIDILARSVVHNVISFNIRCYYRLFHDFVILTYITIYIYI